MVLGNPFASSYAKRDMYERSLDTRCKYLRKKDGFSFCTGFEENVIDEISGYSVGTSVDTRRVAANDAV